MSTTELILFYLGASVVVGVTAVAKGRRGFGYFALSLVLSPILVALLLLVLPSIKPQPVLVLLGRRPASVTTVTIK